MVINKIQNGFLSRSDGFPETFRYDMRLWKYSLKTLNEINEELHYFFLYDRINEPIHCHIS